MQIAKNGIAFTRPNPSVGAVVVYNDKIIGEGFTSKYGKNHAEVNAINAVKDKTFLKEATIYVTLEPCSHYGKTPPCADLIVKHQLKNVVIGCVDSNNLVAGKGIEILKEAGIKVEKIEDQNLVAEAEGKTVVDIEKFFFARNRSDLTPAITGELDKVIDAISRFPQLQLRIETHTDSRGGGSANQKISQKRADVIKSYLLKNGASSSNILEAVGYGEEKIMNNCTNGVYCLDFLHEQNMRTLFVIANYDELK